MPLLAINIMETSLVVKTKVAVDGFQNQRQDVMLTKHQTARNTLIMQQYATLCRVANGQIPQEQLAGVIMQPLAYAIIQHISTTRIAAAMSLAVLGRHGHMVALVSQPVLTLH